MTTDTQSPDPEVMEDAGAWQDLSREEQDDVLDQGLADLKGEAGEGEWRHLDESEQEATISAIESHPNQEVSETEAAMQAALQSTWTARVFEDLEDVPTVPFTCRELDAAEKQRLMHAGQVLMQIEDNAEDIDSLEELEVDTGDFESLEAIDDWMTQLLANVTTDDGFDADRFKTGRGMRPNTRRLLFLEIFLRYHEETERALKFRAER